MGKPRLLVVEDDADIANMLKIYFSGLDYIVDTAPRGSVALEKTRQVLPHLIILDIMLPDIDGYEVCRTLRTNTRTSHIPVIFLTQKDERSDKLQGLELGADDYITKPFDSEILILKIKAILNRHSETEKETETREFNIGGVNFDADYRKLTFPDNTVIQLSPKESDLLRMLCEEKNKILPREKALKTIWGDNNYFTTRSMDVYITKLRKYFKKVPGVAIVNIHGSGYQLRIKE